MMRDLPRRAGASGGGDFSPFFFFFLVWMLGWWDHFTEPGDAQKGEARPSAVNPLHSSNFLLNPR